MGLVDIVSNILKGQAGPGQIQPDPYAMGNTPQPGQMIPGQDDSAGYAMPGNGNPMMGNGQQQQMAQGPSRLQQGAKNIGHAADEANKIMQANTVPAAQFAAQPQLYHALAQAYRGY